MDFEFSDDPKPEDCAALKAGLDRYTVARGVAAWRSRPLALFVRDERRDVIAGLNGHTTSWGRCEIEGLWVAEFARRQGMGRELIRRAEAEAVRRGCHQLYLQSASFHNEAEAFYRRLGFTVMAEQEDYPPGLVNREFMKRLGSRPIYPQLAKHAQTLT